LDKFGNDMHQFRFVFTIGEFILLQTNGEILSVIQKEDRSVSPDIFDILWPEFAVAVAVMVPKGNVMQPELESWGSHVGFGFSDGL
jgi:hypothetical protein